MSVTRENVPIKNRKRPYLFWWARLSNLIFSFHLALLWNFLLTLLLSSRMLIKLDFFRLRHVTKLKPATKVKAFYLLKDYHVYWCHISNTDRAVFCMIVTGYYHEYLRMSVSALFLLNHGLSSSPTIYFVLFCCSYCSTQI